MRLAIVSQQGHKAAGAEHALMQFLSCLPAEVDVSWFFFEDGEFAQEVRRRYACVTIVPMSQRVARAERSGLPLGAVFGSFSMLLRLSAELARRRPDVVLTNSMKAHVLGSIAARLAQVSCINYVHDIVEGFALTLLRTVSGACADERLTCSKAVKRQLQLPRTTVAYAAIDVAKFAQLPDRRTARMALGLPDDGKPIVGLVGRIARWKGQDRFLRIAAAVVRERDAHFCIVGSPLFGCDDAYIDELQSDIVRLGLRDQVTLVPWQDDVRSVYAAIDVGCNCSVREPFGRTSVEALASGVPIVCFDDAGVCEVFEQHRGGIRVPAGAEDAFASAIVQQIDGLRAGRTLREDARAAAEKMDIRTAYDVFADVLERTAGTRLVAGGIDPAGVEPVTAFAAGKAS